MVTADLVRALVGAQFPQWRHLPVEPVKPGGWDNRTFRLGDGMVVRLPSASRYAPQVAKEQRWLPYLAPRVSLAIPRPLALGKPGFGYPFAWSVYEWVSGEPASAGVDDAAALARDLAAFLRSLQAIPAEGAPRPGADNFFRGGALTTYDRETQRAISSLSDSDEWDPASARRVWSAALATVWAGAPVWVHGDVALSNLVVEGGRLRGVIDFGLLAAGDPACDLAIAWTFFDEPGRAVFRRALAVDDGAWARGRGWALWKALVVVTGLAHGHAREAAAARRTLASILAEGTAS